MMMMMNLVVGLLLIRDTVEVSLGSVEETGYASEFEEVFLLSGDKDKDRKLSFEELVEVHGREKAEAMMQFDVDKSGHLEEAELRTMALVIGKKTDEEELPYDEDGDGALSKEELGKHFDAEDVDDILWLLDEDDDGRLESHEILGALAAADDDRDGHLDAQEFAKVTERHSILGKFLTKFRKFARLTPRAQVRKFWSVLKDLECVCPEAAYAAPGGDDILVGSGADMIMTEKSRRPCLVDAQLELELDGKDTAPGGLLRCKFLGGNSTILTSTEFQDAAAATLIPITDVFGDMSYSHFKSFIQRQPSHITGAIAHLIDAGGLVMARSMLVQQLAVNGMGVTLPHLVKDAAAKRYQLANKAQTRKILLDRATAKLVTLLLQVIVFVTVVISGLCYWRYSNIEEDGAKLAAGGDKPLHHACEFQLTRAYLSGFYAKVDGEEYDKENEAKRSGTKQPRSGGETKEDTNRVDLARLLLFRTPALWNMKNGVNIISDRTWRATFEQGVKDSDHIDDVNVFDIASKSLNDLNERRLAHQLW